MSRNKKSGKSAKKPAQQEVKMNIFAKFFSQALPVWCYQLTAAAFLLLCLFSFGLDSIGRASGNIKTTKMTPDDFETVELTKLENGAYKSETTDPIMILNKLPTKVRTLRFEAVYSNPPFEICLYYTNKPGEEFGNDKRVWPAVQTDGSYLFTLPRGNIDRLRLDPASQGVTIRFGDIVLNEEVSFWSYFNPGWSGLVVLLAIPALMSAGLYWLRDVYRHYKPKIAAKKKHDASAKKPTKIMGKK